uniref:uncharacterized protein LOC120342217 isoform X1 n=2 Tax=Styela clava TaxID=7725 RepID=UPI00193A8385|nr:uncharacterized protein LOC120342217 isoform X1 [Styela clava]
MMGAVRMGSPTNGPMFRTDVLGTKSGAFTKMRYLPNRVPDETKHLVDSVLDLDTSKVLNTLGIFKLFLVVPMLILGIILISINSAEIQQNEIEDSIVARRNLTHVILLEDEPEELRPTRIGNESLAPVWTGIMLAASAATDFIAVWRRRGSTIILYMLTSTVTFVASILCIEYDRLQMTFILKNKQHEGHLFKYRIYLACVVLASIAVSVSVLSIYVGSRMGALEESRLYMEREGKNAVLKKKDKMAWSAGVLWLANTIIRKNRPATNGREHMRGEFVSEENISETSGESMWNEGKSPSHLVLAPQNLYRQGEVTTKSEQTRMLRKSENTTLTRVTD